MKKDLRKTSLERSLFNFPDSGSFGLRLGLSPKGVLQFRQNCSSDGQCGCNAEHSSHRKSVAYVTGSCELMI